MPRRGAVMATLMLMSAVLGGCASGNGMLDDGMLFGAGPLASGPAEPTAPVTPAKVVMITGDAAAIGNPTHQTGFIVEEHRPRQRAYTLDTGDRLRVFVYGQPNLSRLYNVDQSGNISVPLIGNIRARGLSTVQLERSLSGRLAQGLVRDPQVTVDVQQNRPFFILGEVRTPGQFPYVNGMTVEMAVAVAGGYGERANERKARLTRRVNGFNEVVDVTADAELEPGDTIYIYERFF